VRELSEPDSAAGLARKVNLPRQKVNYHLRELEAAGLVELVEERRKGNCTERIVRAVARSYLISPEVLGDGVPGPMAKDRYSSANLLSAAAQTIRDVGMLRDQAAQAGKALATLAIEAHVRFASDADRNAFAEDLGNEFAKLVAEYHDADAAGGRDYRFLVGGHPAP